MNHPPSEKGISFRTCHPESSEAQPYAVEGPRVRRVPHGPRAYFPPQPADSKGPEPCRQRLRLRLANVNLERATSDGAPGFTHLTNILSPTYSIVIPAYNESARLRATLDRVLAFLGERRWDAEVL